MAPDGEEIEKETEGGELCLQGGISLIFDRKSIWYWWMKGGGARAKGCGRSMSAILDTTCDILFVLITNHISQETVTLRLVVLK